MDGETMNTELSCASCVPDNWVGSLPPKSSWPVTAGQPFSFTSYSLCSPFLLQPCFAAWHLIVTPHIIRIATWKYLLLISTVCEKLT